MMHSKVDFNLFAVLLAIHEHGSITATAKHLCVTQPAVSHALSRLRDKFSDPLFIRRDKRMHPTPLCRAIIPKVELAITSLQDTLNNSATFDIQLYPKTFFVGCRDILEALFFPNLMTSIEKDTDRVCVESQQVNHSDVSTKLVNGALDLVIDTLFPVGQQIKNTLLGHDKFVLVCREFHPILGKVSMPQYLKYRHVVASLKHSEVSIVDMALTRNQMSRNIALHCESFYAALRVVANSDYLMTVPFCYAHSLADVMPIKIIELPFGVPELPVYMYWSDALDKDPLNIWLREHAYTVGKSLLNQR